MVRSALPIAVALVAFVLSSCGKPPAEPAPNAGPNPAPVAVTPPKPNPIANANPNPDPVVKKKAAAVELLKTFTGHKDGITAMAFSPDSSTLTSGAENIRLWNLSPFSAGNVLEFPAGLNPGRIYSLCFDGTGKKLLAGYGNTSIQVWNVAEGKTNKGLGQVAAGGLTLANDGKTLLFYSMQKIHRVNLEDSKDLPPIPDLPMIRSAVFTPDGKTAICEVEDEKLQAFDVATGKPGWSASRPGDLINRTYSVTSDSRYLAANGGKEAKVWDIVDKKDIVTINPTARVGSFSVAKISPDGKLFAGWVLNDDKLQIFAVPSGELIAEAAYAKGVTALAFSPNGKFLALGSDQFKAPPEVTVWAVPGAK